jgi:hypothetical protein
LLDTTGVPAVRQSQVGKVRAEATATAEAAMAGEGNDQIDRAIGSGVPEVVEGTTSHGRATGTLATARARSRRPVATTPLDARLGQVFDPCDALGDIRNILSWISHRLLS